MFKRLGGPNRMQTAQQLAQTIQLVEVARFGRTAATAWKQGKAKALMFEQALAVVNHRSYHRHFALGQFEGEAVFFKDGFVGPAFRASFSCARVAI